MVGWVMRELFEEELISNMDALLEWAHPGWAFDFSKGFAYEEEGIEKGILPFVNWPRGKIDQEGYTNERRHAWQALKSAILEFNEEKRRMVVPQNFPKGKRSARSRRLA